MRFLSRLLGVSTPARNAGYAAPGFSGEAELRREIRDAIAGDSPIIAGPWLSELGYELLYWIPFLQWLVGEFGVDQNRLIAVSRGGVASWYGNVTANYCDLFDLISETEFRQANEARQARQDNSLKQFHIDDFDNEIAARVRNKLGLPGSRLLHPLLMYRALNPFWAGQREPGFARSILKFHKITPPEHTLRQLLPARYVAVKFYARDSFPADAANTDLIQRYIGKVSAHTPVVVMDHRFSFDDHTSFPQPETANVIRIGEQLSLRDNLAAQTAIVAGAEQIVGTYGGFSYLPLMLGRPAIGIISHDKHHNLGAHAGIVDAMRDALGGDLSIVTADEFRRNAGL